MNKVKVLIVDDHEVVRYGLNLLLNRYDYLEVVGEAQTKEETLALMEQFGPQVVIMDVRLKNCSGIDCCREILRQYPETNVIMLTSFGGADVILNSIEAGAMGFVLKDTGNGELIRAIDAAIKGESILDPMITNKLLNHLRKVPGDLYEKKSNLSKQERKVLELIAEGLSNKEIAKHIFLSEKTVRNYVSRLLGKLNLNNRAEAAVYAVENHIRSRGQTP
ncbi:MAG: DNA-binding response regulator [Firmicutes bacterium HGW-Firmicutes-14]|nr:MAG: DNA-binding response regulator [Firmicutes bacterium HGW-Firmicutes-14]